MFKTVLHNFRKQLNQVWWYSLDPVVTSLQPQFSPNADDKKIFEVRFEFYSPLAFQRAIACLCTSNRTLNVTKHSFVVYTHFPHRHHCSFLSCLGCKSFLSAAAASDDELLLLQSLRFIDVGRMLSGKLTHSLSTRVLPAAVTLFHDF